MATKDDDVVLRVPDYRRVWDCILLVNEQRYAFSDVKARPVQGGAILYSSDLPPIPIKKDDVIKAVFILDYLSPPSCKPIRIGEMSTNGAALFAAAPSATPSGTGGHLLVLKAKSDEAEFHFSRRDAPDANWLLHCASAVSPCAV
jgi:hypothetical protein